MVYETMHDSDCALGGEACTYRVAIVVVQVC